MVPASGEGETTGVAPPVTGWPPSCASVDAGTRERSSKAISHIDSERWARVDVTGRIARAAKRSRSTADLHRSTFVDRVRQQRDDRDGPEAPGKRCPYGMHGIVGSASKAVNPYVQ
jgi:hypothetical protein